MRHLPAKLESDSAVLLIVDVQEKLLPAIPDADVCVAAIRRMVEVAKILSLPVIVTEQYTKGLGPTCADLRDCLGDVKPFEKMRFSACVGGMISRLTELNRSQIIVTGMETHVCIQQTALDLLRLGYTPFVCADAVASRRPLDRDMAIERMREAGAVVSTTESVIFEMVGEAGTDIFKKILRLVK